MQEKKSKYGFEILSNWCQKFAMATSSEEFDGLKMITTPWFLNLYLNIMPPEVTKIFLTYRMF